MVSVGKLESVFIWEQSETSVLPSSACISHVRQLLGSSTDWSVRSVTCAQESFLAKLSNHTQRSQLENCFESEV